MSVWVECGTVIPSGRLRMLLKCNEISSEEHFVVVLSIDESDALVCVWTEKFLGIKAMGVQSL